MNKKLRRIIACLALVLGITGTAVATNVVPASAYLTECGVNVYDPSHVYSLCWNHASNGGLNQQRVMYRCADAPYGSGHVNFVPGYFYGPWANEGQYSFGSCAGRTYIGHAIPYIFAPPGEPTYQLR